MSHSMILCPIVKNVRGIPRIEIMHNVATVFAKLSFPHRHTVMDKRKWTAEKK